jgi:hypothetical protein
MILFNAVPKYSSNIKTGFEQAVCVRAYENMKDENSVFKVVKDSIIPLLHKKTSNMEFYGCVERDDILEDLFLYAVPKIREYAPFYIRVSKSDNSMDLEESKNKNIIDENAFGRLKEMLSVLTSTVGTKNCPFSNRDDFVEKANEVVPTDDVSIRLGAVSPVQYLKDDLFHAISHTVELNSGIKANDRNRKKRIELGKEVPKKESTTTRLDMIFKNCSPLSIEQMAEMCMNYNTTNLKFPEQNFTNICTGKRNTESAEDTYFSNKFKKCAELAEFEKQLEKDKNLHRRTAQLVFWKKQLELVSGMQIDLAIDNFKIMIRELTKESEEREGMER